MNIDKFEKVMEVVKSLGDNAVDGLTVYFGFTFAVNLIGYAVGMAAIICLYKVCNNLIGALSFGSEIRTMILPDERGEVSNNEAVVVRAKILAWQKRDQQEEVIC